jgi:hypothetical protein
MKKSLLILSLLTIPLFGYLFWHVSTPPTLTDTLSPYEKAGEEIQKSFSSLPALPIKEEDTKYTIEDTLTEGIEITYPNKEENTEEVKPSLTLRFPKEYATEPMEVQIAEGKSILIQDKNAKGDYAAESLSLGSTQSNIDPDKKENFFQSLFNKQSDKEKSYLSYTDASKRITTYYAYGHDQATGEKQLKNWQVYTEPAIIKGESVAYSFTNAKLKKNDDGTIGVFYYGEQEIQNEKVQAEVDPSLMARAQRTLAKEMGDNINSGETPANFIIPKPYYINNNGDKIDLDWRLSMDGKDISIDFAPEATEYPLAFDPTLSFTVPAQSNTGDVITGEVASDSFGYSAMTSGDFNADGKVDLAIGAYGYSAYSGRVYIFYADGALGTHAVNADVILTGDTSNRFGSALTAGDFNADGKDDLSVGALTYNGGSNQGRTYVFYGGSMITENASGADVILTGEAGGDYFGNTMTTGDFNADGKTDLAVAAYTASSNGRTYVFYGGSMITENASGADVILTGEAAGNRFGSALIAGDFNADGKDDLVVGANYWTSSTGRAYVFYGGSMISENASGADVTLTGGGTFQYFGSSLATADLNADGKDDLVAGAYIYNSYQGRAYIFYGGSMISEDVSGADITLTGEAVNHYFSVTLDTGDFNADGRTDLAVGAHGYTTNTGRVYIFYNDGSIPTTAATADVIITGEATNNYFGHSFASGDFNADGKTDLAVGAYGHASSKGRTYVFYSQNGQINTNQNITGETTNNLFGSAMTAADFNADGRIDLAVGARGYSANTGRTYIFYGDGQIPSAAATADLIITGQSGDFGGAMITGDLNSDGKIDLVVGAYNYSSWLGRAYIFYNDGSLGTVSCTTDCLASNADVIITGEANLYFGGQFAVGDLNADGRIDLAVGAGAYSSNTGRTYIFYNDGSIPTTVATADVIITGESGSFGGALVIEDLNADGKTDIAVAAPGYSSNAGRAYIFYGDGTNNFGTASCSGTPVLCNASDADIIITGAANAFGTALATGDLNTDGRIDLIAGSGLYVTGDIYIFYNDGSYPTTTATADHTITPYSGASGFGSSIITGDFNADGRTDVAVGSGRSLFTDETGRADIFYNDGSMPTSGSFADVTITGETASNRFGLVMTASDLNADGRTDLIVGAYKYSTDTGRVYVYETRENFAWKLQVVSPVAGGLRVGLSGTGEELNVTGQATNSDFGSAMISGDFNADGKADLVVGAKGYSSNTGRVYIFYNDGSLSPSAINADVIISGSGGGTFGDSIASGDFNADGRIDLAVNATSNDEGVANSGSIYIFYNDGVYPLSSSAADVHIYGEATSNYFGTRILSGDFNADGRTDISASSPQYSSNTGRIYIFYNGAITTENASGADVIITGEATDSAFGSSLAAGDFNADGRMDIAVGARTYNSNTGRGYIFYNDIGGIPGTAATADVIISGSGSMVLGDNMVSGDFNADGKTDIAIASPYSGGIRIFYSDGTNDFGTAACTGSAPTTCLASNADVHITPESSTHIGVGAINSMTAGDFNADGRIDLAVGARDYSTDTGRGYIFYNDGSIPTTAATADIILTGEATSSHFGSALTSGDFNADGKTDLIIGAYGYSTNKGRIYMYTFNDPVITGEATSNTFGSSFASGDFNADGKIDLAISASGYSTNTGRVYIFYSDGSMPSLAASADVIITGEATGNYFGSAFTAGDFNNDGRIDLATSAYGYSTNNGRVYIFYNDGSIPTAAGSADVIIAGTSGNQLGRAFTSGDINADGTTDLVVGNNGRNVYIFYNDGSYPASDSLANVNIDDGGGISNAFGRALTAGDFNGDNRMDLAIGSSSYLDYDYTGRVYIFYNDGSIPTTSATADVTITGETTGGYFGQVLTAGDFNTDGRIDLATSARTYNFSHGRTYIFYTDGSPYPSSAASADVIIDGAASSSYFGEGLAAGDFNADGRTDLAVGDTRAGGSFNGRVFVFYNDGSYPATTSSADAVMNGSAANDYFGAVMEAGDFNADGKVDLAVGAYGYSTNTGRVYLVTSEVAVKSIPDPVRTRGTVKLRGTSKLR